MSQANKKGPTGSQLDFERRLLDEARDEIESGLRLNEAEVKAWLAGLDGEEDLPVPDLRRSGKPAS